MFIVVRQKGVSVEAARIIMPVAANGGVENPSTVSQCKPNPKPDSGGWNRASIRVVHAGAFVNIFGFMVRARGV